MDAAPESKTTSETEYDSIERCFHAEESPLLRYAFTYVRRREVAEEIVQEAFMRLHQHWDSVDTPRPWLYRAVRNLSLNHLRKHQREQLSELQDSLPAQPSQDHNAGQSEVLIHIRMLMAEMKPKDRELIRLKFVENLSYTHIGEQLDMGVGNVGYRLHHLLKSLGDSLRHLGIDSSNG